MDGQQHNYRISVSNLLLSVLIVAAAIGGYLIGVGAVADPDDDLLNNITLPTIVLEEGTIGRTMRVPLLIGWDYTIVRSPWAGVVTSRHVSQEKANDGDVVASINLEPIYAVSGSVPFTRELVLGTIGPDVEQIQDFLKDAGFLDQVDTEAKLDRSTMRAFRAWQKSIGVTTPPWLIRQGTFVAIEALPVYLDTSVLEVGATIEVGSVLAKQIDGQPNIVLPILSDQLALLTLPVPITFEYESNTFELEATDVRETDDGGLLLVVTDTSSACDGDCSGILQIGADLRLTANIEVVPESSGVLAPLSAITVDSQGRTFVSDASGSNIEVMIVGDDGRFAVITGVEIGQEVLVFGSGE